MDDREFDERMDRFGRLVATLEVAADLIRDWRRSANADEARGAEAAVEDLNKRLTSALESVGFDPADFFSDDDLVPGTEAAKRIEAEVDEAEEGCGAEGPEGYRCTEHRGGEHIARGPDPETFAETWPLRDGDLAEAAANRGDRAGGHEDAAEVRARVWGDYTAERSRMKIEEDER